MKKLLSWMMLLIVSAPLWAAPIKTIKFATEATYPPFESVGNHGELQGFDVDVANALCQQMQAKCEFSNQAFNGLIPSLKIGKFDAIISAMGVTEERAKQVAFTHAYYEPSASFVAPLNKKYSLDNITGKTVGTQEGNTFVAYLQDQYKGKVNIKTYASIQDAFLDLQSGRVDMIITDTPAANNWLQQGQNNKKYGVIGKPMTDSKYFGNGYAIAVRLSNTELLDALNKALSEIKSNGTYAAIVKKYFNE